MDMEEKSVPDGILLADYPKLPLPDDRVEQLLGASHDWAHANGLVMRTNQQKERSDVCQSAPFALLPSPFPRKLFQQALDVQNHMAALYHELAYDYKFLIESHAEVIKTDEFTRKLVEILKIVMEEGLAQPVSLAIQRSDYMCHKDPFTSEYALKQIEINNIASSMGAHAARVSRMHRRTFAELGYDREFIDKSLPTNDPISLVAEGLYKAWKFFNDPSSVVLVVIEDVNQNAIDQRHVEYALEDLGVPVDQIVRKTLTELNQSLTLGENKQLLYCGSRVAVVYFRAGYSPSSYPSPIEWNVRLTMERSDAIKCPWIGLQVANTKKTQQVLAEDGVVERYIGNPRHANTIRSTFAGLYAISSNDPITTKLIQGAISHPERFVLKPQTEGGGGNYYGDEMVQMLKTMSQEERGAHILMERIQPMKIENYLIRANQPTELISSVSELGIYGYAFGSRGKPETLTKGHLLRTKGEKTNEGGVAVGAAVIDSPFLYELL